jgi:hypothetical protein
LASEVNEAILSLSLSANRAESALSRTLKQIEYAQRKLDDFLRVSAPRVTLQLPIPTADQLLAESANAADKDAKADTAPVHSATAHVHTGSAAVAQSGAQPAASGSEAPGGSSASGRRVSSHTPASLAALLSSLHHGGTALGPSGPFGFPLGLILQLSENSSNYLSMRAASRSAAAAMAARASAATSHSHSHGQQRSAADEEKEDSDDEMA